jgi:hypothetical protein
MESNIKFTDYQSIKFDNFFFILSQNFETLFDCNLYLMIHQMIIDFFRKHQMWSNDFE